MSTDSMVTADQIKLIDDARVRLFECTTQEEVENVFDSFKIFDLKARTALLHRCMQIQSVYGIPGDTPESDEDIYQEELAFFVDGQWRKLI